MKFVADENFDNRIIRGLLRRLPGLDIVRAQDLEIAGARDPVLLTWAAAEGRILLTHDQKTIPDHVFQYIGSGGSVAGVVVAKDSLPISVIIEELVLMVESSTETEWIDRVVRLPL